MFYIFQCVPFSSVLTLLPRNKNRPDIRNSDLQLSDGTKLLPFKKAKSEVPMGLETPKTPQDTVVKIKKRVGVGFLTYKNIY